MEPAPHWNRFAHWPRSPARVALALLAVLLALAALTSLTVGRGEEAKPPPLAGSSDAATQERFDDLRLYDNVIARMRHGEGYYDVIVEEHRKIPFPVTPGFAVRLPTLAYLLVALGDEGQGPTRLVPGEAIASILLFLAVIAAWWRRLGDEPGGSEHRLLAVALLLPGLTFLTVREFHVLHELWAGGLIALALGLHRPGRRWGAALAVAALALAIRETVLPFALLLGAMAAWRRDWREAASWAVLAMVFVALWAWHLQVISAQLRPDDPTSASWITLRGLSGLLSLYVLPTPLRFLPSWLANPVIVLALFGWAGWKSPLGTTVTLLLLGYGLAFMIAGRPENWYWGALVTTVIFAGLAFAAGSLRGAARAAR